MSFSASFTGVASLAAFTVPPRATVTAVTVGGTAATYAVVNGKVVVTSPTATDLSAIVVTMDQESLGSTTPGTPIAGSSVARAAPSAHCTYASYGPPASTLGSVGETYFQIEFGVEWTRAFNGWSVSWAPETIRVASASEVNSETAGAIHGIMRYFNAGINNRKQFLWGVIVPAYLCPMGAQVELRARVVSNAGTWLVSLNQAPVNMASSTAIISNVSVAAGQSLDLRLFGSQGVGGTSRWRGEQVLNTTATQVNAKGWIPAHGYPLFLTAQEPPTADAAGTTSIAVTDFHVTIHRSNIL